MQRTASHPKVCVVRPALLCAIAQTLFIRKKQVGELVRTSKAASGGEFGRFKASSLLDGTAENPEWLGEVPERLQKLLKDTTGQAE
jgi:hypothetical protein